MISLYNDLTGLCPWGLAYCLALSAIHVVVGSIAFDLVHWTAHQSGRSSNPILRRLARIHVVHHQYFDRRLNFNQAFSTWNMLLHLLLELLCQVIGSLVSWQLTHVMALRTSLLANQDILLVLIFLIIRSYVVAWNEGRDSNHIRYTRLPKDPYSVIVGPQYHALHHIDPRGYFGSMVRLVDWLFGTATTLRGRRIAMTGARGALGQALLKELSQEKGTSIQTLQFGRDWNYNDYCGLEENLRNTDILVLAHGSKKADVAFKANCESAIAIIDSFMRVREQSRSLLLPEIWYIGSEAELHGAWTDDMRHYTDSKRAFVPFARAYYDDENFIYRHIVPAAFSSGMDQALVSPRWAATLSLWWIRRGARYVPVTYTGMALLNFFRFQYWVKPNKLSAVHRESEQSLFE
ncbi:Fatty acid hydroxylase [Fusarium oxysporum f. sp. vasinfectum]|nr:Fatty acid hydroxylase [Fusarium oxysporum f. sp. vasinfectum]